MNKTETEMDGTDNILKTYYYFYAGSGMKHIPGNPDLPWGVKLWCKWNFGQNM